jgi:monoamine oxidase
MSRAVTRRDALAAFAASLANPALASPALATPALGQTRDAAFDVDVVVIGAGAAGVGAARELRRLGKSCLVLEARARVGGRVFTDQSLGQPFDAGALYIHWAERNPWTQLARDYGFELVDPSAMSGGSRFVDRGGEGGAGGGRRGGFWAVQSLFDAEAGEVPDVSFMERVGGPQAEGAGAAMSIARMALGDEPERISALDYARLWSGDDYVLPLGYGALLTRAAQGLDIRLSTPVQAIDWSGAGVRVSTREGEVRARVCIVTLPVGVLRSGAVRFTPALPAATQDALNGLGMGALTKIALRFNGERFGVPTGMDIWERIGPRASFNFECFAWDRDLVIATFGGDHAREIVRLGETGAVDHALEAFARLVGADARKALRGGRLAAWSADPFSLGCYSHAAPGRAGARAALAQPVGARLFFAGEATANGGGARDDFGPAMTAGGAWLAGVDAARRAFG